MEQPTFNELLINEVKAHPQLYDQQQRVCTDNGERNVIWETIALRIDNTINGEFAKKRWLQMRDRYRKELKMAMRTSIPPKWPYFSKLNWLDPYLKDAKSIKSENCSSPDQTAEIAQIRPEFQPLAYLSTDKDQEQHHLQFPQIQTVNLLETLMAASRELLERQREKITTCADSGQQLHQQAPAANQQLEISSPDSSAVASTSDEGGEFPRNNIMMEENNDNNNTNDMGRAAMVEENEEEEKNGDQRNIDSQHGNKNSLAHLISQRFSLANQPHSLFTPLIPTQVDLNALLGSPTPLANFGGLSNDDHQLLNFPIQASRVRSSRTHPPYLVRRGNKQQRNSRPHSESNLSHSSLRKFDVDSVCSNNNINNISTELLMMEELPTAEEWSRMDLDNDEDLLFARLVVARLKKFESKRRREIRFTIHQLLDKSEEDAEMMEEKEGQGEKNGVAVGQ